MIIHQPNFIRLLAFGSSILSRNLQTVRRTYRRRLVRSPFHGKCRIAEVAEMRSTTCAIGKCFLPNVLSRALRYIREHARDTVGGTQ